MGTSKVSSEMVKVKIQKGYFELQSGRNVNLAVIAVRGMVDLITKKLETAKSKEDFRGLVSDYYLDQKQLYTWMKPATLPNVKEKVRSEKLVPLTHLLEALDKWTRVQDGALVVKAKKAAKK